MADPQNDPFSKESRPNLRDVIVLQTTVEWSIFILETHTYGYGDVNVGDSWCKLAK